MTSNSPRFPLVKFPDHTDRILFLIREELKLVKFFKALADAGLSDPDIRPCLDLLIMRELGLSTCSDDFFGQYLDLMDKHSALADGSSDNSFAEHALQVYEILKRLAQLG